MGKIAVLDKNMINMIAAGEVIERPASVVKEMLENSIDAGATKIVVKIEDGGKRLISVTDDGCGMSKEDIPTAFEPHATSKIRTVDDLTAIESMGFRGEALASIGSVAKVRVVSREADSIEAYSLEMDCGDKSSVMPASGSQGTTIEVRDLFYKLPARRKFLRTTSTEMTHITEHFTRIALANCNIDLTLMHNNRQIHRLHATSNLLGRISELMNAQISQDLIEINAEEKGIKIQALIAKPVNARGNNKFQYTFLNGRFIRDKFIMHAIKEAYRGLIEPNKHPVAFLFIEMPYDSYDVNVHPTKVEIRFDNSNLVHSQILGVLREKLHSLDLDVTSSLDKHYATGGNIAANASQSREEINRRERISDAMENFFTKSSPPINAQGGFSFSASKNSSRKNAGGNFNSAPDSGAFGNNHKAASSQNVRDFSPQNESQQTQECNIIQIHNSYIVAQTSEGFSIIDQHALHERIIYERLCDKLLRNNETLESQKLLIPETIELTAAQQQAIEKNKSTFEKLGIEIEAFGPKTYAIHSFPTLLKDSDVAQFVEQILDAIMDSTISPDAEKLLHEIMDMTSCKAAIKAGQALSIEEMCELLSEKENTQRSSRCPHGRPTTIKFSIEELEKQFKRTGF